MRRLTFDEWSKEEVSSFLTENQFIVFRQLETGEWIGLMRLAFTMSVCMDITPMSPFAYRWCFADTKEALFFYENAKEFDEVPTLRATLKGHRYTKAPLLIEYDELGFQKW
jgi:hypothetical protein